MVSNVFQLKIVPCLDGFLTIQQKDAALGSEIEG